MPQLLHTYWWELEVTSWMRVVYQIVCLDFEDMRREKLSKRVLTVICEEQKCLLCQVVNLCLWNITRLLVTHSWGLTSCESTAVTKRQYQNVMTENWKH